MVVINEIRSNWFKAIESRQDLPKPLKDLVFRKSHNKCSNPDCKTKSTQFEIDHIKPIANGGHPTKLSNLQLLCKPCHNVKSQSEKEFGYKKISDTESSFNIQTKEIFNSALCSSYAFIEKVADPKNKANKIYYLDINKCRKNILYFNQFDYPVFSVMDMPIAYTNQNCPGLYYVETDNYVPLRGNGWYYYPTIKYCLENNLIKHTDIKYVIQSSLTLKHNHYNSFIDFCYDPENLDKDLSKLAINGMIGQFKPKPRDNWQSIITTSDKNEAMNHLLKFKTSFLDCHHINFADEENPQFEDFYHVYKRTSVLKEETEAPIYNMILELEAIELHKLKTLVESHKGTVLDLNTDCVTCVFRNNKLPFELIKDSDNIEGYYFDDAKKVPKYKLEHKPEGYRLKNSKLENYKRTVKYELIKNVWDSINYEQIISSNKSVRIDGLAGTGKTYTCKQLMTEMTAQKKKFILLAPTNKACRKMSTPTTKAQTLFSFCTRFEKSRSSLEKLKVDYIFVDEISMMHERMYKFLIMLKQIRPDIKLILSGNFDQLEPVNDRAKFDYENSPALYELADGQILKLTKCQRQKDEDLFNMIHPNNIPNLTKTDFNNSSTTNKHLAFTNAKRMEINKIMMEKFIKNKKLSITSDRVLHLLKNSNDGNSQDVYLLKGMPIISKANNKKYEIANNDTFIIDSISLSKEDGLKYIYIKPEDAETTQPISMNDFQKLFRVAFCITVHSSQGDTFNVPYTCHEFDRYSNKMKYTALSRTTEKSYINII